jgi:V8-like Glu-specific endopeptidase
MEFPNTQTRPSCQQCSTGRGFAHSLTLKDGVHTIGYVCDSCHHTWTSTEAVRSENQLLLEFDVYVPTP